MMKEIKVYTDKNILEFRHLKTQSSLISYTLLQLQ